MGGHGSVCTDSTPANRGNYPSNRRSSSLYQSCPNWEPRQHQTEAYSGRGNGAGRSHGFVYGFVRHVTYTEQITFVPCCSNNFMYNIKNNRRKPIWCTSLASVLACVLLCMCQPRSINSSKVASNVVPDMPSHASEESKWYQLVDLWGFDVNQ